MAIGSLIKTIQDIMRKDVGVDGDAQRISQIVWLLFLKIFDDNKTQLRGCPTPMLPPAEQHRIVAKIEQLMALCDRLEQQIDNAASKQTALLNTVMAQV